MRQYRPLARAFPQTDGSHQGAGEVLRAYGSEYRRAMAAAATAERLSHDLATATKLLRDGFCGPR